ncbi:hypothetical protein BDZ97DRAFT_906788 [Flammula alnicola]|nr:hypothetical protein BDZ97DRAFT_906788 [Flammula alnicola]
MEGCAVGVNEIPILMCSARAETDGARAGINVHLVSHITQILILQNGDANMRKNLAVYCMKDVYLPQAKEARAAHLPFNAMRVAGNLQAIAKRTAQAAEKGHLAVDR